MKVPPLRGRTLHESLFDPRLFRLQVKQQVNVSSKQEFAGQAPGLFVGRFGYPRVRLGLLATEQYERHDDPLSWVRRGVLLGEVVRLRSELVNAGRQAHVKLPSARLAEKVKSLAQEAAMAVKPVKMDVGLDKKPVFRLRMEDDAMPHGPLAGLRSARVTSNPKIPSLVEKTVDDGDLRAADGLGRLWRRGFGEHQLSKLLSAGTLGQKLERRLVPTRWGITAVDDIVGKQLHGKLQDFAELDFRAYFGGYMGNYFLVLLLPQPWAFELFENYVGRGTRRLQTRYHDVEGVRGRSSYAENTAGGYYAARLAVLEHLVGLRRKAGVLVLRFISDEYWAPLGVWVVREAVRAALVEKPLLFGSWELLRQYAVSLVRRKFGADVGVVLSASRVLFERRSQTTLGRFS
ncbi:hypothetical protein GF367_00350 [Candidatus Woesearchaeota archaeon]|nr:hypothetical protein [Candidatus Woesearchaeota archaeon]